jgi:hypothetical protein
MSSVAPTSLLSSISSASGEGGVIVPSFAASLALLLENPSMLLHPSEIAELEDPLRILRIQAVRAYLDHASMLGNRSGLVYHPDSNFEYVTQPSKQASTISPESVSRGKSGASSVDGSSALSAIADKFSETWHTQTNGNARDELDAELGEITVLCDREFPQNERLKHMRHVLKLGTRAKETLSNAEDQRLRDTDWALFHSCVVVCVQRDLQDSVHHESFEATYPDLQVEKYQEKFALGQHSTMSKTVALHVRELRVKLATDAWPRKQLVLHVIHRWKHAVHFGGELALFEKTKNAKILDGDCQEDALDLMDYERNLRWNEAAQELLGRHWMREYRHIRGEASLRDRSSD